MKDRQKIAIISAEMLGTFMLACAVLASLRLFTFTAAWYASISVGLTLSLLVLTLGKVSGSHVNPAVTIGLWTMQKIKTAQALTYIAAQVVGGALALFFYEFVTNTSSELIATPFDARIFIAEVVGAAIFGFGIAAVVLKKLDGFQAAFGIGFSLFLGVLVASIAAPGFLNPAVALANSVFDWTVVVAPLLGVTAGMQLYALLMPIEKQPKSR